MIMTSLCGLSCVSLSSFQLEKEIVFTAISTHRGEEVICLKAHREIKNIYPELVTIIIPRHINRISEIKTDENLVVF